MMKYLSVLLFGLCVCFAIQGAALHAVGGRTVKSESNFFSSLGRIQAGSRGNPQIMMLGSSITGRLPDRAQGFEGLANLGCDGGSAADTLRAIDEGRLPVAPVLLIEANSLQVALRGENEVASAMREPWFQVGTKIPCLSAYARPAAFTYSPLLARRTGSYRIAGSDDLQVDSGPGRPPEDWVDEPLSNQERNLAGELSEKIRSIQERGVRIVFLWLPPARPLRTPPAPWIRWLVKESGGEWWDLAKSMPPEMVRLTDGVHMDAATAGRTANLILSAFEGHLEPAP